MTPEYRAELRERFLNDPWEETEGGKYRVGLCGRLITFFHAKGNWKYPGGWTWVCDGKFGPQKYPSLELAREMAFDYLIRSIKTP